MSKQCWNNVEIITSNQYYFDIDLTLLWYLNNIEFISNLCWNSIEYTLKWHRNYIDLISKMYQNDVKSISF